MRLWTSFWACLGLIAVILLIRVWNLRLLYLDANIREQTKITLETIAEQENWLLSDMSLRVVTPRAIVIYHRQHMRGKDPVSCYAIPFSTPTLIPCS